MKSENEEIQNKFQEDQFLKENMVNDIINNIIDNVIKQVETKILTEKSKQFKHCSQSYNNLLSYEKNNNNIGETCTTTPGSTAGSAILIHEKKYKNTRLEIFPSLFR